MSLVSGTRLGPYEVVSLLGAGGMGEVYRATDARLARDVAIKVLPEEFFEDEERRSRFAREARLLAALSHPNIAAVHSFEEVPGSSPSTSRHILVMELVDGVPLSRRMKASAISLPEALSIGRDIAAALEAAHARGIVHRDLKPGNVMVSTDGRVRLLDFGLAKAFGEDVGSSDLSHSPTVTAGTATGVILGTAAYMSPEQARGQKVDARTDVWALGVVLWELLTGRRLFQGQSTPDTLAAVLREPVDFKRLPIRTPQEVRGLLARCLERNHEKRLGDVGEARRILERAAARRTTALVPNLTLAAASRLLVALAAIVALAIAGAHFARRSPPGLEGAGNVKRIAILPFENLGAVEDEYLADGMADEIRGQLASLPGVEVIARASSAPYKKTTKDQRQIAQELDVKYLLTATVRWDKSSGASRVHVSPELVEVKKSGAPTSKWQQPFDAALTDVFRVQSDIGARVAQALGVALGAGEVRRLTETPTSNPAAMDAFLKGEEASGTGGLPGWRKALGFYEEAVALDPGFARAWARVSLACGVLNSESTPTAALAERWGQAAERAIALAPNRPEGYIALGKYQESVLHDSTRAAEQFARARRIAPGDAEVLASSGWAEIELGNVDAAVEYFRLAARLDPRSSHSHGSLGFALFCLRRYTEAREALDRGLALVPASPEMLRVKAETFLGVGDLAAARAALREAPVQLDRTVLVTHLASYNDLVWVLDEDQRRLLEGLTARAFDDNQWLWAICLTQAYALKGDVVRVQMYADLARKALEEDLRADPDAWQRRGYLGLALAYLGKKEEAIEEAVHNVANEPKKDGVEGIARRLLLVRVRILVGDVDSALEELESLERIPHCYVSPGWLEIDPNFDPLRKNPRFQKLVAGK